MAKFIQFENKATGMLNEIITINVDAIAAIQIGVQTATSIIHTVGGGKFNIDPANLTAFEEIIDPDRIHRVEK
jgi:hypothetical protein